MVLPDLIFLVGSSFRRACHENHQLSYKCRQLKNEGKIHSTWFWNNPVNVKLDERSQPTKINHVIDIEKLLGVDNLGEFISNTSF